MWQDIMIGLAGLAGWVVTVHLVQRRRSIDTPAGWGLSLGFLLVFPELSGLGARSYLAALVIMSALLAGIRFLRRRTGR